jgi:hypothetical protein
LGRAGDALAIKGVRAPLTVVVVAHGFVVAVVLG